MTHVTGGHENYVGAKTQRPPWSWLAGDDPEAVVLDFVTVLAAPDTLTRF
jgi:hypothetical protein